MVNATIGHSSVGDTTTAHSANAAGKACLAGVTWSAEIQRRAVEVATGGVTHIAGKEETWCTAVTNGSRRSGAIQLAVGDQTTRRHGSTNAVDEVVTRSTLCASCRVSAETIGVANAAIGGKNEAGLTKRASGGCGVSGTTGNDGRHADTRAVAQVIACLADGTG